MKQLAADTGPEVGNVPGTEDALVADVVDCEHAPGAAEDLPVPGVGRAQQQRREGRVPVVAVHDVRREPEPLAALECSTRQHQVAQVLVRTVGVELRPVEERGTVDQVNGCRCARASRALHVVDELARTDRERQPL